MKIQRRTLLAAGLTGLASMATRTVRAAAGGPRARFVISVSGPIMTTGGLVETDSDLSTAHDLAKQIQLTPPRQR